MSLQFDAENSQETREVSIPASVRTLYAAAFPSCPACHERLLAPELSEFYGAGRIRHYWACDTCGTPSETSVKLNAL